MARTPQSVGFNDPALLNTTSAPTVAKTSPPRLSSNGTVSTPGGTTSRGITPTVSNGTTTYNQAVQATSGTEVFIVSSNNNDTNDIVTVYNTDKAISVSAINQTYNSYNLTNTNSYGNSNVAAFLPTFTGVLGAGSLTVTGVSDLGDLSNVYIGGGTNGQVLTTNGSGALTWSDVSSNGGGFGNIIINGDTISSTNDIVQVIGNTYVQIQSNGQNWKFENDGNLTLPSDTSSINYANGSPYGGSGNGNYGNSNVATFLASFGSNTITTTGNSNVGNLNTTRVVATGNISGTQLISNIATGTSPFVVTSTTQVANLSVATAGTATTAGTVTTNSQPNITSTGTLTTLSVSGNSNIGNIGTSGLITATGNITGGNLTTGGVVTATGNIQGANVNTGGSVSATGNVTGGNLRTVGVVTATGNVTGGNIITGGIVSATGNITANFFIGDGSQLTGLNTSSISNGSSNVSIDGVGGDVTTFVDGVLRLTVSDGATNINGTLSVSGNANIGNIGAADGVFTTIGGSLTTNSQPNITSVGTLTSLSVSGNITGGNIIGPLANGNSNVNIATANGNVSITSNGTQTWTFDTTGNLIFPDSSIQTTAPVAEFPFNIQSSDFNADAGARYGVDTTAGTVSATLPATPATGVAIFFADAGGAYSTNNLTIIRNGETIMGSATNLVVSTNNQSVGLFYNGTTWRIYNAG